MYLESHRHHGTATGDSDDALLVGVKGSLLSGKGGKPAVEYSTVQPLLLLRANWSNNAHISEC